VVNVEEVVILKIITSVRGNNPRKKIKVKFSVDLIKMKTYGGEEI
jgi:hypothetical protein